jgi:hypothetical protein
MDQRPTPQDVHRLDTRKYIVLLVLALILVALLVAREFVAAPVI